MVNTIISIPGYVHLVPLPFAVLRHAGKEVREMLYLLNTANLNCYEYYHPERVVIQSGPVAFCGWLETKDCRPYRTEVQLYKSLLFLKRSIDRDLIVSAQREACKPYAVLSPIWNTASIRPMAWRSRTNARSMGNVPTVWFQGRTNPACA